MKFPAVRVLVRRLARTANWQCTRCDTWNDDTYKICHVCG